jgi:hypothetical protein
LACECDACINTACHHIGCRNDGEFYDRYNNKHSSPWCANHYLLWQKERLERQEMERQEMERQSMYLIRQQTTHDEVRRIDQEYQRGMDQRFNLQRAVVRTKNSFGVLEST